LTRIFLCDKLKPTVVERLENDKKGCLRDAQGMPMCRGQDPDSKSGFSAHEQSGG